MPRFCNSDARKNFTVDITMQDVVSARRMDANHCVLAHGLVRCPAVFCAVVGVKITFITSLGGTKRYVTPDALGAAIRAYDGGIDWAIPPGEHTFLAPRGSKTLRAVRMQEVKDRLRRKKHISTGVVKPMRKISISPRVITQRDLMRIKSIG